MKRGYEILNDPFLNKGTTFSKAEREQLGLDGLLPPHIQSIEEQARQVYLHFKTKGEENRKA